MNTPPDQNPTPSRTPPSNDDESFAFTPKLILACVLGILAVGVLSGAAFAGLQDVASPAKAVATPSGPELAKLLEEITYKTPVPTITVDPSVTRTPIVGIFPTPGNDSSSGSGSSTSTTPTPQAAITGGAASPVPTVNLGTGTTPVTTNNSSSTLATPVPTVARSASTPAASVATPAQSTPAPTPRAASTP